jgi:tetratricopeptide (TPR) repeat protein
MKKIAFLLNIFLLFTMIPGCAEQIKLSESPADNSDQQFKARDHFTAGIFYQLDNQHERALIEFYEALLYDSTSYTIYNRIADNHMSLGRYESALRYLQKSLTVRTDVPETYRLLADCYHRLQDDQNAIANLKKVLALDPYDDNSRSFLMLLYRKTNDQLGVAAQYKEMVGLYCQSEDWIHTAGLIYLRNGNIDEAIDLFRDYLKTDSSSVVILSVLGTAYEMKSDTNNAIATYQKILKIAPGAEEVASNLYRLARNNNDWPVLSETFAPLIAEKPDVTFYRLALAEAYYYQNRLDETEKLLTPLLSLDPVPWQALEYLGRIEMDRDNFALATTYFRRIIEYDPDNRIGWIYLGFALTDSDSLVLAEQNYRQALKYLPEDPFIWSFHGISLSRLGKDNEALTSFEKALQYDPRNMNALLSYGLTLNRLDRKQDAIKIFRRAMSVDSSDLTAITTLGLLYDELRMYTQLDSLYKQALGIHPDNDLILNNYAYSLAERNLMLDYALSLSSKAVEKQPENGAYLDTKGWIYYKLGRYDQALEWIKKSLENREESAVVIEHLGDVYIKLGKQSEAKIYWRRALMLDPDNNTLKKKIEQDYK